MCLTVVARAAVAKNTAHNGTNTNVGLSAYLSFDLIY